MDFSQQELLKALINALDMTREAFSERYNISVRALNNWLLPSQSKGYRKMPDALLTKITDELIELVSNEYTRVDLSDYDENKDPLVALTNDCTTIYFPSMYLSRGLYDTKEMSEYMDVSQIEGLKDDGTFYQEHIRFNPKNGCGAKNLLSYENRLLKKATAINGENYWAHLVHYRTAAQAQSASEALYNVFSNGDDAEDETLVYHIQVVLFNGCYFLFFLMPAPIWCDKPLLCYVSKSLTRNAWGGMSYDFWQHVIDENGHIIPMPSRPSDLI